MENLVRLYITPIDLSTVLGISVQFFHKFAKDSGINTRELGGRAHRIAPDVAREIIMKRGLPFPRKIINVHNLKGGVGKTTSVHALATRAASYGFKVLVIDLDQQANLTSSFGVTPDPRNQFTIEQLFNKSKTSTLQPSDCVVRVCENLDLIPANLSLANFDTKLTLDYTFDVTTAMKDALGDIENNYDLIFIDSPPALSKVTTMAHLYSDMVLIPIEPEKFSLDGLEIIFAHLRSLIKKQRPDLETRIFINKYDNKPKIDYAIATEVNNHYGEFLCEAVIPLTSGLKASIAEGDVVWASPKKHNALIGFDNLLKEILNLNELWSKVSARQSPSATVPSRQPDSQPSI